MKCISGIYYIKNTKENKVYIGSSKNIKNRLYTHFNLLKKGIHPNKHLNHSFSLYGEQYFESGILEKCSIDNLLKCEKYYIDKFNALNPNFGYNIAPIVCTNNSCKQYVPKNKLSEKNVRIIKILIHLKFSDRIISKYTSVNRNAIYNIRMFKTYHEYSPDIEINEDSYEDIISDGMFDAYVEELGKLGFNMDWYFNIVDDYDNFFVTGTGYKEEFYDCFGL